MEISADVYLVCLLQALSTEKEEVMGLLIGEASSSQRRGEIIISFQRGHGMGNIWKP